MQPRTLLRAATFLFYAIVAATPLFYLSRTVYPYGLAKSLFFQGAVELLFFAWILLAYADPRFRISRTPLTVAFAVFGAFLLLTTFTGVDPWRSFWSTQERAVGVFTMLHVLALVFIGRSLSREIRFEPLFYVSLGVSSLVSVLGFLQLYIPNFLLSSETVQSRPGSTFGNPSFLAGYLTFNLFIAVYLFLRERLRPKEERSRSAPWFLTAVLLADGLALFLTETRGDILGALVGAVLLLVLFAVEPPGKHIFGRRRTYAIILASLAGLGIFFGVTRGNPLWSAVPGLGRFQDLSLSSESLAPRLIAIEAAWKGFKERPFLGWGWDNYNVVFNKFYDPRALEANYQETRFDKPHNFVLEYLVVGGLPLTLAYAAVFAAFFWETRRVRDRLWGNIALAAAGAYVVRNLFVFETIGPLLMWGLFLGLTDGLYAKRKRELQPSPAKEKPYAGRIPWGAAGAAFVPACILVYSVNVLSVQASGYQFQGLNYFLNNRPQQGIENFKRAITVWSPYGWGLKRDYAAAVVEAYFYNPGRIPPDEARRAIQAMEEVAQEHPQDAYNHYALIDMYNQASDVDPETFLPAAEREAAEALALSPRRQEVYFSLAKTKSLEGDNPAALKILEEAIVLDPKVADAHFYYGLIAYALHDNDTGYREIKKALELGRKWKKYNEPRVVGNFFADSGHLDEAIPLYEAALALEPGDLESRTKLGIAYFIKGDKDRARQYLEEVSRKFDFRTSPSYDSMKPILDALGIGK